MKRRFFLKSMAVLSATPFLHACNDSELPPASWKILIIGGGASGLYAAQLLLNRGYAVTVLEAADQWGGRVRTLSGFANFNIELGAEEIHGANSVLRQWAKDANAPVVSINTEDYFDMQTRFAAETNLLNNSDFLAAQNFVNSLEIYTGADKTVAALFAERGLNANVRNIVNAQSGNEFGTDINNLSAKGVALEQAEWTAGNDNFKLANKTFESLIAIKCPNAIAETKLNVVVKKVDYSGAKVVLTDAQNKTYEADRVLVTVPLAILKRNDLVFSPQLPDATARTAAMNRIGMDGGMKVILKFSSRFWAADLGSIVGSNAVPEYWFTSLGRGDTPILTAFVNGATAAALSALSETQIVNSILADLNRLYGNAATPVFLEAKVMDWSKMPFIGGTYSYPKVGYSLADRAVLANSVNKKVFFAGEATHMKGHSGTLHGALETAETAVDALIKSF